MLEMLFKLRHRRVRQRPLGQEPKIAKIAAIGSSWHDAPRVHEKALSSNATLDGQRNQSSNSMAALPSFFAGKR
jgi:hypothetical protein